MKVNGGEDVADLGSCDVELGEQFHLSTRNLRIDAELSGHRDKILLENLE